MKLKIHEKTINIENLRTTNPQRFWDNIRKIKTKATTRLFTINKSQNIKDIVQEFRQHFQTLLNTPLILNNNHNPSQILSLSKEPNSLIITSADIINCISQLNSNKSPDSCGLSAEHLKNSHNNNLLLWLAKFYNSILSNGKVPNDLSTSTIIPLVMSYTKSLNNPDNYRGISILPIFTKLLEYLILRICFSITDSHSHQFGFKKNSSTLHAEFLLSETVMHYKNNNTPLYMCSLDANKAFDTCNWDLLFEKLYFQKKLPLSVVHTISSLYHSDSANISYQGVTSNQFSLSQGVRQGSILSPHSYNIYTESILNENVSECKVGSTINEIYTGVIAYADDVILLSPTISGLQELINRFQTYGVANFIKLNTEKTEFLISGKSYIPNNVVKINGTVSDLLKHFHYRHGISSTQNCKIPCRQGGCCRTYESVHALKIHLYRKHPSNPYTKYESINISPMERNDELKDQQGSYTAAYVDKDNTSNIYSGVLYEENIKEMILDVLMTLRCHNTTEVVIQYLGKSVKK
nr:uncharacterized protein LOC124808474 [Hydra vulgaris]